MLRQILGNLPRHGKPYVLAFAAIRDADLAAAGAALTAIGLEHIGARALVVKGGEPVALAEDQNFILVDARHDLARNADLEILVLTPEEDRLRPANAQRITLVLDLASATNKPRLVASNGNAAALATG
jgi:hypothetical protein